MAEIKTETKCVEYTQNDTQLDKILESQLNEIKKCNFLSETSIKELCCLASEILIEESNLQHISSPIILVGDIHGQFFDLIELFGVGGDVPDTKYCFLGDYVDRGYYSVETFTLLLLLKVKYPDKIILLRGNHESRQVTQSFGFYDECMKKYCSINVWRYFTDIFDLLPISCIINNNILCVHGGLSPSINTLDQINIIDRKQEVPYEGAFCDLLWSDPDDISEWSISPRGAGYIFGENVVKRFNDINNIDIICRAHQLVMEGYKYMFNYRIVTVWSAPNYCYRCGNIASIMEIKNNNDYDFKIFMEASDDVRDVKTKKITPDYFL